MPDPTSDPSTAYSFKDPSWLNHGDEQGRTLNLWFSRLEPCTPADVAATAALAAGEAPDLEGTTGMLPCMTISELCRGDGPLAVEPAILAERLAGATHLHGGAACETCLVSATILQRRTAGAESPGLALLLGS